ncbi:MAG: hypothetical protein AB8B72_09685 [Crocinitomicaceae bacterium]
MENAIRIVIIGDYNFAYHSHNATNKALQHVEKILDQQINFFWYGEHEFCEFKDEEIQGYDGVLIAPGPFQKPFYFTSIIDRLKVMDMPVLGTGEIFKIVVQSHFSDLQLNKNGEKIISDNLVDGNHFTQVNLTNLSPECDKIYIHRGAVEFSSSRFSILPQYSDILAESFEIGARNQYFDPEIIKSKDLNFFMFTMFCPQMNSSEDIPHPLFTYFIKTVVRLNDMKMTSENR